jgi:hypothetical protein
MAREMPGLPPIAFFGNGISLLVAVVFLTRAGVFPRLVMETGIQISKLCSGGSSRFSIFAVSQALSLFDHYLALLCHNVALFPDC